MGAQGYGIDTTRLNEYAAQIREALEMGVQVGIVIGGGNIFRGLSGAGKGFDRVKGDGHQLPRVEFRPRCHRSQVPRAHRHPHGADWRTLQQVESH